MGCACREGRAIVEGVWLSAFGELDLSLEGVDLAPTLQHLLLFFGKIDRHNGDPATVV